MGGGRVIHLHDSAEFAKVLSDSRSAFGGKGVVVDFSASWCGPCKMMAPVFERLSEQYPAVTFAEVDVDELQDVAQSCKVTAMPTFQAYFNGDLVDTLVGADPRKLEAMISSLAARAPAVGTGQKLGGGAGSSSAAAGSGQDDMRARMLAAAEARARGGAAPS